MTLTWLDGLGHVQGPVRGFEQHVGSRSTYESLNGFWVKELLDDRRGYRWNWRSRDTGLLLFELFEPWAFIWYISLPLPLATFYLGRGRCVPLHPCPNYTARFPPTLQP